MNFKSVVLLVLIAGSSAAHFASGQVQPATVTPQTGQVAPGTRPAQARRSGNSSQLHRPGGYFAQPNFRGPQNSQRFYRSYGVPGTVTRVAPNGRFYGSPNSNWRNPNGYQNWRTNPNAGTNAGVNPNGNVDGISRYGNGSGMGDRYAYRRAWDRNRHDRNWYRTHYTRFAVFGGGYYYQNAGYWYPAYGYDPYFSSYSYDAPIYSYNDQDPAQVIANVQTELQRLGYDPGAVDGTYGPSTRLAILNFQGDNGLPATGEIDQATLDSLGLR